MRFTTMMMGGLILGITSTTATVEEFKTSMRARPSKMDGYYYCDYCAEVCFMTEDCRRDPNSQGSYCKKDHHPATCFGLYHTRPHYLRDERGDGFEKHRKRFCYQPNDPECPEQFPVLCEKPHHDHHDDYEEEHHHDHHHHHHHHHHHDDHHHHHKKHHKKHDRKRRGE